MSLLFVFPLERLQAPMTSSVCLRESNCDKHYRLMYLTHLYQKIIDNNADHSDQSGTVTWETKNRLINIISSLTSTDQYQVILFFSSAKDQMSSFFIS